MPVLEAPIAGTVLRAVDREQLVQRARRLEYFTLLYNSLEGVISVFVGLLSGSIALVGFGFDSAIEVASGATILLSLRRPDPRAERRALQTVGLCFIALALYVAQDAARLLFRREAPTRSVIGIILAVTSLLVMPLLANAKRKVARRLSSAAIAADATQTQFCTYLSAILLAGLLLNAVFGWWWADPVAAVAMLPVIVNEGIEALRGKTCCG